MRDERSRNIKFRFVIASTAAADLQPQSPSAMDAPNAISWLDWSYDPVSKYLEAALWFHKEMFWGGRK